jgi:heat-inducible transcriptional repressor
MVVPSLAQARIRNACQAGDLIQLRWIPIMTGELTERQTKILRAIVEEYTSTAEPVASECLERKYGLGVSPATIRSEMAKLTEAGYLRQPHTSAGRVPSSVGLKFYISRLMEERTLPVTDEVSAKAGVWDCRFNQEKLLHEAVRVLAEKTRALALATTDQGSTYYSGYANILEIPEFYDIDVAHQVLALLDHEQQMRDILLGRPWGDRPFNVFLGEELNLPFMEPVGMVFSQFHLGNKTTGTVGVIGSVRLNYPQVIPMVKYMSRLLSELTAV